MNLGKLVLGLLLTINLANAAELIKVFGLKDQDFAEVSGKKLNRYQISDNLIASMQLDKDETNDYYSPFRENRKYGSIELTFTKPELRNWNFTETLWLHGYRLSSDTAKEERYLKFVDEFGLVLTLLISDGDISAGDKRMARAADNKEAHIQVLYDNGKVTFYVNGQILYSSAKQFGKLKHIKQDMHVSRHGASDDLHSLILSEIK